ncbi:MAG: response regulator [Gammaproteobacteria bacterium]|nr:response regulator [Gammaproteobacteria bacterium]
MKNLRNKQNSLSLKVGLGFAIIALILITALTMIIFQLISINRLTIQVSSAELPLITLSNDILNEANKTQVQQRLWLIDHNPSTFATRNQIWANEIFQRLLSMQALSAQNEMDLQKLNKLQNDLLLLKKAQDNVETMTTLTKDQRDKSFLTIVTPLMEIVRSDSTSYRDEHRMQLQGILQQIKVLLTVVFLITTGFLFIGVILSILMAIILMRSITRPIYALVNSTKELATGNLSKDFAIIGSLEFEELSQSLNNVVMTLRIVANVTEKMAMGDYSQRVPVKSEQDQLAISVNQMLSNFNQIVNQANLIANGDYSNDIEPRSPIDKLGEALHNMTKTLRQNKRFSDTQNWLKDGLASFARIVGETQDLTTLGAKAISEISHYTQAGCGTLYVYTEKKEILQLLGTYALSKTHTLRKQFRIGEGIIGQVGLEKKPILLKKNENIFIISGTMEKSAETVYCIPILYEKSLIGVLELAWDHEISELVKQYLESLTPMLASHMQAAYQQKITEQLLHEQKSLTEKLQVQQRELKQTAEELSLASQYKSEFLANMSHELRTPLNSLIILAKLFAQNREKTLNDDQLESAKIMVKSGNDLLTLINDILDLAKVEAGKIEIQLQRTHLKAFLETIDRNFKFVAEERNLQFLVELSPALPEWIATDEQRVLQVIRNLISNAIKFTEEGYVKLSIEPARVDEIVHLAEGERYVAFRVSDTGIGIPKEKQELVFEKFQQADGTTSRKYGGTGLGLSISTQFAELLHGRLTLESKKGKGSTFSLIIPENHELLADLSLEKNSELHQNISAKTAAESIVHYLEKPINEKQLTKTLTQIQEKTNSSIRSLLIVEDSLTHLDVMRKILMRKNLTIESASTGTEALYKLMNSNFDCVILDLGLPDIPGEEILKRLKESKKGSYPAIIIYTGKDLSRKETVALENYADSIILKGSDSSMDKLQEKTASFLDKTDDSLQDNIENEALPQDTIFHNEKILVVDDDMRNVYALSRALKIFGLNAILASNGKAAIEILEKNTDIKLVLMDIMMPVMDGYEAISKIRQYPEFKTLPIIAVTAKTMANDREKCMQLGASDFLAKPIDTDILLSALKTWIIPSSEEH